MWQTLRSELHPQGLEIVTVALDTAGTEAVRPWIEAANPDHPSLIDQAHILDELLGVVNVPNGVWIDEQGMIVRPPEPAYPRRPTSFRRHDSASQDLVEGELSPQQRRAREIRAEVRKIRIEPEAYIAALRAWVANGAASRYALAPDEVTRRSHARPPEVAEAAASFELGQYLHREAMPMPLYPGSAPHIACNPTTGPISAKPGHLSIKSRVQTMSTTAIGSPMSARLEPRTITRRWICESTST